MSNKADIIKRLVDEGHIDVTEVITLMDKGQEPLEVKIVKDRPICSGGMWCAMACNENCVAPEGKKIGYW